MPQAGDALLGPMTPGLVALLAALAVALAGGAIWRRTNGRMRSPRVPGAAATASLGAPVMTLDPADPAMLPETADAGLILTGDQLGDQLGDRATLLQFSSAFCAPCRATRRILAEVAGMTEGVAHIEIDAESRLDLVRELNVLRTPTVLVLASDGRIVRRASGQPRKPDVIAAIGVAAGV
jgi:thiol-disulfide isomerase/thioredoxin